MPSICPYTGRDCKRTNFSAVAAIFKKDLDKFVYAVYTVYTIHIQLCIERGDCVRIIVSNQSEKPIYQQIMSQIKDGILRGALQADELLPSIRGLAKELQISVITTKKAYEELEKEGFLVSVPGKGFYVAPQNRALMREVRLKKVEEALECAVETARSMQISREEVQEMLRLLYEEV